MTTSDPSPWSRPSLRDVQDVIRDIPEIDGPDHRTANRLPLSVPAEIVTHRGNRVPSMTRDMSFAGIGLVHRGAVSPGTVTLKVSSDAIVSYYELELLWCIPCAHGLFISGGRFLRGPA